MRRLLLSPVLALLLIATGCRSWNVDAFGVPVGARPGYAALDGTPAAAPLKLGHHAELTLDGLSKDEKQGVVVTVVVAIAAIVAFMIAN